jgi:hypothetical protein
MTTTTSPAENQILISNRNLYDVMIDDNYFIPVKFSNSDKIEVLRFIDNMNELSSETACKEFYKHLHFALNVCISKGWNAFEEHINRNGFKLEFVGLMDAEQFKSEYNHLLPDLNFQY